MEKASDVYLTITDNSIQASGTQEMKFIIPMLTIKGELGLNRVTAATFKDIVGYNMTKYPNYDGLSRILSGVSYAYVWRLNQGTKIANCLFKSDGTKSHADTDDLDVIKEDKTSILKVANKCPGDWGSTTVCFKPTEKVVTVKRAITITLAGGLSTIKFYDSNDYTLLASVSNGNLYAVENNVVTETVLGTVVSGSDATVITISEGKSISSDSFWNVHTVATENKDWTLVVKGGKSYEFSLNADSDINISKVDFGDLYVDGSNIPSTAQVEFELEGGSNGSDTVNFADVKYDILNTCGCNIMLMNGFTASGDNYKILTRMVSYLEKNKIHAFVDAPDEEEYIDLEEWAKKIPNSKYIAIGARPDEDEYNGKPYFIYPSVNYALIYAKMMNNYGNLNYPPAGATYGSVTASNLLKCDYELYANELKTNRINWQRVRSAGTMMWEQRTTYTLDSDFSYIAPTFIMDALADELISFEQNYNFRYMTPTDILNQKSGLTSILQNYVDNNFLYSFELKMPTYDEAQKSGRTLTIPINIVIMKDSEVIQINVQVNNA